MLKCFVIIKKMMLGLIAILFFMESPLADEFNFERTSLIIMSESGNHVFDVEIADTDDLRRQGLQFREVLAPNEGMLFDFVTPIAVNMWMKNTQVSLDMVFLDEELIVRNIIRDTEPFSLETLSSDGPVRYVLELNAKTTIKIGIKPGDKIAFE